MDPDPSDPDSKGSIDLSLLRAKDLSYSTKAHVLDPGPGSGFSCNDGSRSGFNEPGSDPLLVESKNLNNLVGQASPVLPQTALILLLDIQTVVTGADPGPIYTYCRIRILSKKLCYKIKKR